MERLRGTRGRVAAVAAAVGLAVGVGGVAGAATSGSSTSSSVAATTPAPQSGGQQDPAALGHGPGETLLTGSAAQKVRAAAQAAVPGGTILRVETDSGDAAYEAHVRKADGTFTTVLLDSSFKVTGTESGFGGGHGDGGPGAGAPPAAPQQ